MATGPDESGRAPQRPSGADPKLAHKVVDGLNAGVYVTDAQERIIAVNPRAEELLARPSSELIGEDAHDLLHRGVGGRPIPRSQCRLMQAFLEGEPAQGGEKWFTRGDGTLLPVVWLVVPYDLGEGVAGASVIFYERSREEAEAFEPSDRATELADLAEGLSLVSETTATLTSTLEVSEALRRLLRLVTPRLADWAIVDLISDGGELRRVAVVHHREGGHTNVPGLEGPIPPVPEESTMSLARVLRGAPTTRMASDEYASLTDEELAVAQRELLRRTGIHSAIIAPLRSPRDVVLGALTLGRAEQEHDFDTTELALVDDIARRAGLAVDNARLYERQQRTADTMQRYLLPRLPRPDGLEMAARYHPAPPSSEVGGDWYDVFLLPDGTTILVIGDVVGHHIPAAAHMAELRSMLRAFAWDHEEPPSRIIDRLDRALPLLTQVPMATAILARVEERQERMWQLFWTNAGHPPPLLITRDGRARFLENGYDLLLGTGFATERTDTTTPLPERATVLFYTDGLVESASTSLEEGRAALAEHATSLIDLPLGELCDLLIERVRPADGDDDVALLALRLPPAAKG